MLQPEVEKQKRIEISWLRFFAAAAWRAQNQELSSQFQFESLNSQ